jgi:hypothetical protein
MRQRLGTLCRWKWEISRPYGARHHGWGHDYYPRHSYTTILRTRPACAFLYSRRRDTCGLHVHNGRAVSSFEEELRCVKRWENRRHPVLERHGWPGTVLLPNCARGISSPESHHETDIIRTVKRDEESANAIVRSHLRRQRDGSANVVIVVSNTNRFPLLPEYGTVGDELHLHSP